MADGVGGHNSGEVASRTTMTDIAGFIRENPIPDSEGDDILIDYFLSLITEVNTHVREMAQDTAPRGMATTLLMLYIKADTAYVINIGDSRAYLIRDGRDFSDHGRSYLCSRSGQERHYHGSAGSDAPGQKYDHPGYRCGKVCRTRFLYV